MMDLATIRQLSRQQAAKARRVGKIPFVVEQEDLDDWKQAVSTGHYPRLPFPNIGTYRPKGFTAGDRIFVDKSGMGDEDEPAMTIRRLVNERLQVGKAYAITEEGEFQLYLTEFTPPAKKTVLFPTAMVRSWKMEKLEPYIVTEDDAPTISEWMRERGGIAIFRSRSNPGTTWTTPATDVNGEPVSKPTWAGGPVLERIITDPAEVVVSQDIEIKRFHVDMRLGSQGQAMDVTDEDSERIRAEVAKAGESAYHVIDTDSEEAVMLKPVKQIR